MNEGGGRMLDEDIRIASDTPSRELRGPSDLGESVAREFTRHKENGNIFMANRLGEELARPLLENDPDLFGSAPERLDQMRFLYGFAVRLAIFDGVRVSILADTALHSFLETVENADASIYATLTDSISDTIYRLCLSDRQCVGGVFAKLCAGGDDAALEREGGELYERFRGRAALQIAKVTFKP